jgi:hypothetical protein
MTTNDIERGGEQRDDLQDLDASGGMCLDHEPLLGRERTRLPQDRFRRPDVADVVQEGAQLQGLPLGPTQLEPSDTIRAGGSPKKSANPTTRRGRPTGKSSWRLSMPDQFEYISRSRIEYKDGYRHAYLGDLPEPVVYGVQGALREYYGAKEGPPIASTLDHIVAAVAG